MSEEVVRQVAHVPIPGKEGCTEMVIEVSKTKNYNKGEPPLGFSTWEAYEAYCAGLKPAGYKVNPRT